MGLLGGIASISKKASIVEKLTIFLVKQMLRLNQVVIPARGLLTTIGGTLILISLALDFSYGNYYLIHFV